MIRTGPISHRAGLLYHVHDPDHCPHGGDSIAVETFSTEYDAFNRPVREKYQYGNGPGVALSEYAYDAYQAKKVKDKNPVQDASSWSRVFFTHLF